MMGGSIRSKVIGVFTYVCVAVRISVFQVEPEFNGLQYEINPRMF